MTNVTEITRDSRSTSGSREDGRNVMDFQHVPMSLRTRVTLGAIGIGLVTTGLVAGVFAYGDHQGSPVPGKTPQPTAADYEVQDDQPLNGS